MNKLVIVGASAAGFSLASAVRARNKRCSITLITEEEYPAYDRRKLLLYFAGKIREKELFTATNADYGRDNLTLIKEARAAGVNCDRGTLQLKKGDKRESVPFDILAVCTGMKTVIPDIPGSRKEGVLAFDSLADVKAAKSVVINGPVCLAGEWNTRAAALAQLFVLEHKEVKVITPGQAAQAPCGVEVINSSVVEMIGESGLQAVKLREGKIIGTGLCLFTGPLAPSTEFLASGGVDLDNGFVAVDEGFKTSRQNVFACGAVTGKCVSWEEAQSQAGILSETLANLLS